MRKPAPIPRVKNLHCPSCGAPHEIRGGPRSQTLICGYCDTAIDLRDDTFNILWQYQQQIKFEPLIPLGTRGTLRGELLECLGYVRRTVTVEGIDYTWSEYLLYNPFKGYRWLTEYNGHWTIVREAFALPLGPGGPIAADPPRDGFINYMGMRFRHFQSAAARVTYVLGEFYWEFRLDDQAHAHDYVAPPYMLSAEETSNEITWSVGEYIPSNEIWSAFKLAGGPLSATGVAPAQPNKITDSGRLWRDYLLFVALAFLVTLAFAMMSQNKSVYTGGYTYYANEKERSQVSDYFNLTGRTSNVVVSINTNLSNRWAFFRLALINDATDTAIDFPAEAYYYSGVDGGESWSEGSNKTTVLVPQVPSGRYYLRIEPESGTGDSSEPFKPDQPSPGAEVFKYDITVKRDVVQWGYFFIILVVLLPFPIIQSWRRHAFENRRWMESDHPPVTSSED
jgi:hypothetical protein